MTQQKSTDYEFPGTPRSSFKVENDSPSDISNQQYSHTQVDFIGRIMADERRLVIGDLMVLLRSVNEVNMEPNGASIVRIGSSLSL